MMSKLWIGSFLEEKYIQESLKETCFFLWMCMGCENPHQQFVRFVFFCLVDVASRNIQSGGYGNLDSWTEMGGKVDAWSICVSLRLPGILAVG